jgi:hypothetical protein
MVESVRLSISWGALLVGGFIFFFIVAWCDFFNHLMVFTKIADYHKEWLVLKMARLFMLIESI